MQRGTLSSTIDSSIVVGGNNTNNDIATKKDNFNNGGSANDIFNFDEYLQNVQENSGFFEKFVRT